MKKRKNRNPKVLSPNIYRETLLSQALTPSTRWRAFQAMTALARECVKRGIKIAFVASSTTRHADFRQRIAGIRKDRKAAKLIRYFDSSQKAALEWLEAA